MDDVLQEVGVTTGRNTVEERPFRDPHPVDDTVPTQHARGGLDDPRQIVEDATRLGRRSQNGGQLRTLPAANIDDGPVGTEVITGHHRRNRHLRNARHEPIEKFGMPRLFGEVLEALLAVHRRHDRFPGSDRINQQAPPFALLFRPGE